MKLTRTERERLVEAAGVGAIIGGLLMVVALSMHGEKAPDADAQCTRLLEKYATLRQKNADEKSSEKLLESKAQSALETARVTGALERCKSSLTTEVLACAETAGHVNQFEQCFP
jgi:hypothetical protein